MMSSPIQSSSHFSSSVTSSSTGSSSCSHRNVATRNPLLKPLQTFQFRNLRHFHPPILTMARLLVPLFAVIISCALLRGHLADEPDLNMKVPQMIELRGFRSEIHRVITDDCYVLDLHRIVHPNGFQSDSIGQGRPVLFVHGLMGSSAEWIMNSAGGHYQNDADNRSLAFHLARIGFDIWLGNNRGNEYTSHVIYSKKLPGGYWDYSIDNLALNDLPAMIGYVRNVTQQNQIGYVGFSQGTKQMMQLLSLRPEMSRTVAPIVLLGPVTRNRNSRTLFSYVARFGTLLRLAAQMPPFGVLRNMLLNQIGVYDACGNVDKCAQLFLSIPGYSEPLMNTTRFPVYMQHFPNSISTKHMIHYLQHLNTGNFQQFDHGPLINIRCYGRSDAPSIPLHRLSSSHMHFFYSKVDQMAPYEDLQWTWSQFNSDVKYKSYEIDDPNWQHLDFEMATNTDTKVNHRVAQVFANWSATGQPNVDPLPIPVYTSQTCEINYGLCSSVTAFRRLISLFG